MRFVGPTRVPGCSAAPRRSQAQRRVEKGRMNPHGKATSSGPLCESPTSRRRAMTVSLSAVARSAVSTGVGLLVCTCVIAAESVAPGINERFSTEEGRNASAEIFEAEDRHTYQRPDDVIRHLRLEHGDVACEIGAGT